MMRVVFVGVVAAVSLFAGKADAPESAIDRLIRETGSVPVPMASTGALWTPDAQLGLLASDLRPRRVNDIVTIVVRDRASALARGTVKSTRTSDARAGVDTLFGNPPLGGPRRLPNLLGLSSNSNLEGEGETSRETTLNTTLAARVTHVLSNGLLVVAAEKHVRINSDVQTVIVRGIVRPVDVTATNLVYSDQLADLEIAVNGKGVITDAVRRPNILYRILLGVLPF